MAETIFPDGVYCDEHVFDDNNKITKVAIDLNRFTAWASQHLNEKGYVKLIIASKRDKSGLYAKLDTFKANGTRAKAPQPQEDYNQDYQHQENQQQQPSHQDQQRFAQTDRPQQRNDFPAMPNDKPLTRDQEGEDIPF